MRRSEGNCQASPSALRCGVVPPPTRFGLLGPLLVEDSAGSKEIAAPRHRALLAALLLNANKPVSGSDIAHQAWNGDPPARATGTRHSYLRRLRTVLRAPGAAI